MLLLNSRCVGAACSRLTQASLAQLMQQANRCVGNQLEVVNTARSHEQPVRQHYLHYLTRADDFETQSCDGQVASLQAKTTSAAEKPRACTACTAPDTPQGQPSRSACPWPSMPLIPHQDVRHLHHLQPRCDCSLSGLACLPHARSTRIATSSTTPPSFPIPASSPTPL